MRNTNKTPAVTAKPQQEPFQPRTVLLQIPRHFPTVKERKRVYLVHVYKQSRTQNAFFLLFVRFSSPRSLKAIFRACIWFQGEVLSALASL